MVVKEQQIQSMLEPVVESLGFSLWGLEYLPQRRHSLLRLYIDSDQGVQIDDCARVSRQVSSVLDVEDPIRGEYTLEVSSPGVDRMLFRPEQYQRYLDERVEMRLREPFDGRRKFKGTLKGVTAEDVVILIDEHEFLLPFSSVDRAQVKPRVRV